MESTKIGGMQAQVSFMRSGAKCFGMQEDFWKMGFMGEGTVYL